MTKKLFFFLQILYDADISIDAEKCKLFSEQNKNRKNYLCF